MHRCQPIKTNDGAGRTTRRGMFEYSIDTLVLHGVLSFRGASCLYIYIYIYYRGISYFCASGRLRACCLLLEIRHVSDFGELRLWFHGCNGWTAAVPSYRFEHDFLRERPSIPDTKPRGRNLHGCGEPPIF